MGLGATQHHLAIDLVSPNQILNAALTFRRCNPLRSRDLEIQIHPMSRYSDCLDERSWRSHAILELLRPKDGDGTVSCYRNDCRQLADCRLNHIRGRFIAMHGVEGDLHSVATLAPVLSLADYPVGYLTERTMTTTSASANPVRKLTSQGTVGVIDAHESRHRLEFSAWAEFHLPRHTLDHCSVRSSSQCANRTAVPSLPQPGPRDYQPATTSLFEGQNSRRVRAQRYRRAATTSWTLGRIERGRRWRHPHEADISELRS